MKNRKYILLSAIILFIFQNCETNVKPENTNSKDRRTQSCELDQNGKDTINRVDVNGLKQGLWKETIDAKTDYYSKDKDTVIYKDGIIVKRGLKSTAMLTKKIILQGQYNGKNLFMKNSYGKDGVGFCVHETKVNNQTTTDEINADMFMIDLAALPLKIGEEIKIEIRYANNCTPRTKPLILNPGAISSSSEIEKGISSFVIQGKYNYQNILISNSPGPNGKGFGLKEILINGKPFTENFNLPNFQIDLYKMNLTNDNPITIEFKYMSGFDPMILNPEGLN